MPSGCPRTGTLADAAEIGKALAAELLDRGADSILGHWEQPDQNEHDDPHP